ncbi:MAG: MaoC family dehydratase [Leptospiraceae bacterium]|nr:MaoC family dehydratase N-terminal domain-containing protein [Leptospiraceae bacterium]MCK6381270.1 MaoC family dehydratase [Leptospiraceae bacterium]NUM41816.1 MaoC family dehydratase N-terminal domain-containing protein [Leptospiraceae bacterium]
MAKIEYPPFAEIASKTKFERGDVIQKTYGRFLDEFKEGDIFSHPRSLTIDRSFAQEFATVFMEANPLYLSAPYAIAHGFKDILVSPLLIFNIALSLGVQNDSEKAVANLGYYDVQFLLPVYPGDTLFSKTKILKVEDKGEDKPGIIHVRTVCLNQNNQLVLNYERKIMINHSKGKPKGNSTPGNPNSYFPKEEKSVIELPLLQYPKDYKDSTGEGTYFESFQIGQIFIHSNGRTITDEHVPWTYRVGNTHPLHYDRLYSKSLSGAMSGEPIVYGGLVFAWLGGLASRDVSENAIWDLGYTEGYHTQPAISGDTVTAISRVLHVEDTGNKFGIGAGEVQFQFIGLKNIRAKDAFEKFGADLFLKENDKKKLGKEKISEKIFEIERRLLIKKKPI